jgi:hypothetical protein
MKKLFAAVLVIPLFLTACSNPLISWIDTTAVQPFSGNDMAIISFSSGISGEAVMLSGGPDDTGRIPIKILLPAGSPRRFTPEISYIGKSLFPESGIGRDFSKDVEYTVTADNGDTKAYVVEVSVKNEGLPEIVWFNIELGNGLLAEGVITPPGGGGGGVC